MFLRRSTLHNIETLNSQSDHGETEEKPAKKSRRCCGMPLWLFILICVAVIIIITLAVLLPVFLVAVPNEKANKESTCETSHPCKNGGVSVSSGLNIFPEVSLQCFFPFATQRWALSPACPGVAEARMRAQEKFLRTLRRHSIFVLIQLQSWLSSARVMSHARRKTSSYQSVTFRFRARLVGSSLCNWMICHHKHSLLETLSRQ